MLTRKAPQESQGSVYKTPGRFREDGSWDGRADAYSGPLDALARDLARRRDSERLTPSDMVRLANSPAAMPGAAVWELLDDPNRWHLAPARTAFESFLKYGPTHDPAWRREGKPRAPQKEEVEAFKNLEGRW